MSNTSVEENESNHTPKFDNKVIEVQEYDFIKQAKDETTLYVSRHFFDQFPDAQLGSLENEFNSLFKVSTLSNFAERKSKFAAIKANQSQNT